MNEERTEHTLRIPLSQLLAAHPEWDEATRCLVSGLFEQTEKLEGENKRLRKALLASQAKTPRMSSKLRDALYE